MELFRPAASSMSARCVAFTRSPIRLYQCLHTSSTQKATPLPLPTVSGPPPLPPQVSASQPEDRVARKRKQAELLERGKSLRTNAAKPSSVLQKRFWKDAAVKETPDGLHIMLDTRPVRTASKQVLALPKSKRALATGIALEWDLLVSTQQALKQHYIPLTSLTSRAFDIQIADSQSNNKIRDDLLQMLMRYLSTDTLLCWAPEKNRHDPSQDTTREQNSAKTLREKQIETARPIIAFLTTYVFPGVEVVPILGEESILPTPQPEMTREIVRGWIAGLPAFELAALERAVLASKSLLVGIRLLVEWSREYEHLRKEDVKERFGIEEAAEACSVEVRYQTSMWGEVEDTHDVEKEDLRRQLGSVILLVT
ncbi:ATP synthase mitochondrial F1 complex assembly factor 2 [Elasticomyces elasticus]|nr:ATP synthase mitochondrial F1 complex assembly factor 2 [Elasticomyces elasticus]